MVLLLAPNVSMVKSSSIFRLAVRFPRFRWSCLSFLGSRFWYFCVAVAHLVAEELGDEPIRNQGGVHLLLPSLLRLFV